MKAKIYVTLKPSVLDPQGKAIHHSVELLGYKDVADIRQGKYFEIDVAEADTAKAMTAVKAMCEKLIANTVIENYDIELA